MGSVYFVHILTGTVGLVTGFIALFVVKGATVHRRAGMAFVYSMLAMSIAGGFMAVIMNKAPETNVTAAGITAYLVLTSFITVRDGMRTRASDLVLMLTALTIGSVAFSWGVEAMANGGRRNGMPATPYFIFAAFGLLGAFGDLRVMLRGPLKGAQRLARHLWRMSMALLIAALSFAVQFVNLMKQRAGIKVSPLFILFMLLLVAGTTLYWMWRVRFRKSLRGLVLVSSAAAPAPSA
jgi:hypothetical protein